MTQREILSGQIQPDVQMQQLQPVCDPLQAMLGSFDTQLRCQYASLAFAQLYRMSPEELLGKTVPEIVGQKVWHSTQMHFQSVLQGQTVHFSCEVQLGLPSMRWIDVQLLPHTLASGEQMGFFVLIEASRLQQVGQQSLEPSREPSRELSQERAQRFMQAGTEGIVFYRNGMIIDCNEAFQNILGKTRAELMSKPASHVFQQQDRELAEKHMHLGRESSYSAQLPHANGGLVTVEINSRPVQIDGQATWVAVVRDNSQLSSLNDALLRSQARYRSLVDNSDQCALITEDKKIIYANRAAQKLFGPHSEGLRGIDAIHLIHPDDRAHALLRRKQMIAGDTHKEVMVRSISPPSEHLQPHSRITWVRLHGSVIEWEGSVGMVYFLTNVTDLRDSEEKMRKALAQEKELGDLKTRFVSMASHEFRTPLATIQISSELLEHYNDRLSQEQRAEAVIDIQRAVARMQGMMDSFLAFGRMDSGMTAFEPRPTVLLDCLQGLIQETRLVHNRSHAISVYLEPPLQIDTQLMLDQVLFGQMVMNLITNAAKYSARGTKISIIASQIEDNNGLFLRISVRDQGMGIAQDELPRLFDSFYRASNAGQIPGTGLGLAIVDRAARAHGGKVQVRSELGQGSQFTLSLPWVQAQDMAPITVAAAI